MKKINLLVIATSLVVALPAFAQHGGGGGGRGGGGGHFPSGPPHGPTPVRAAPMAQPQAPQPGSGYARPYVSPDARWIGHESGPQDMRFRQERPFSRGRFAGPMGPGHAQRLHGFDFDRHRFRLGPAFFIIAVVDLPYVDDWDWSDDDIALYDDPDHAGWYLAYNTRTGTYVHAQYDGEE